MHTDQKHANPHLRRTIYTIVLGLWPRSATCEASWRLYDSHSCIHRRSYHNMYRGLHSEQTHAKSYLRRTTYSICKASSRLYDSHSCIPGRSYHNMYRGWHSKQTHAKPYLRRTIYTIVFRLWPRSATCKASLILYDSHSCIPRRSYHNMYRGLHSKQTHANPYLRRTIYTIVLGLWPRPASCKASLRLYDSHSCIHRCSYHNMYRGL